MRALPSFRYFSRFIYLVGPGAVVFAMAYDNGAYSLPSRSFWAIAIWWAVILVVALRPVQARTVTWSTLAVVSALSAFALLTLVSPLWGSSTERAVNEFNRVSLYLGVFVLALLLSSRGSRARWCDSLALGICAVVAVSLISRFAPETFSDRGAVELLPSAVTRLSFPLGYWNGLAIFAALSIPLLLRAAAAPGPMFVRVAAVAPLPAVAVVMYLASSRGGYITAAVGAVAFVLLSPERWWPAAAAAVGSASAAVALAILARQSAFVNDPLSELGREQSTSVLVVVVLASLAAGGAYAILLVGLRGRRAPTRRVAAATVMAMGIVVVAALAVSDPVGRFRAFKRPPLEAVTPTNDFVRSHLLSANGSGRWQFWESAIDAFQAMPLLGQGAGSYEAWWAEHGSLALFVRDAHSLYLEALAELGVVGFLLVAGVFLVGLVTASIRLRRLPRAEARDLAAPTAVLVAYCAAVAIDWMWELTVVSVVAFTCLALLVGSAPFTVVPKHSVRVRPGYVVVGVTTAWFLICLQAIPYLSELRIHTSQEAAARGDGGAALDAAESARAIRPWAASPWLQLALVREELGDFQEAESAVGRAIDRDSSDWRLWLVRARLETKLGDVPAARASLRRARSLNPRSPLFTEG